MEGADCELECREGYETFVKPPNLEAPDDQIWSQPVAYCKKSERIEGEEVAGGGGPEELLFTLHSFGYQPGRPTSDIDSAQAYFWYDERREGPGGEAEFERRGGSEGVRHFNLPAVAGRTEYGEMSTTTHALEQYPGRKPVGAMVRLQKGGEAHKSYFGGAPSEVNIYCQDLSEKFGDRRICVSGNLRQLNRLEAKDRGFRVGGDFALMREAGSVPREGHWVEVGGRELRLTYLSPSSERFPGRYIKRGVPRAALEKLDAGPSRVSLEGGGGECWVRNIIGGKVYAICPDEAE
jgi:hypothetical protein